MRHLHFDLFFVFSLFFFCLSLILPFFFFFFFFFNDTATTEIYTLSLHDALPISAIWARITSGPKRPSGGRSRPSTSSDRKSTRLNSSHSQISYAVFCLKKKKKTKIPLLTTENTHCYTPTRYVNTSTSRPIIDSSC